MHSNITSRRITRLNTASLLILVASFVLPFLFAAQAWGADPEAGIPLCCRSHGKHKCFMRRGASPSGTAPLAATQPTVTEKCPCGMPASSSGTITHHSAELASTSAFPQKQQTSPLLSPSSRRTSSHFNALKLRGPPAHPSFA